MFIDGVVQTFATALCCFVIAALLWLRVPEIARRISDAIVLKDWTLVTMWGFLLIMAAVVGSGLAINGLQIIAGVQQ